MARGDFAIKFEVEPIVKLVCEDTGCANNLASQPGGYLACNLKHLVVNGAGQCAYRRELSGENATETGAQLIAEERRRQIEQEGWTPEHDDKHVHGELALAAAAYAVNTTGAFPEAVESLWPWSSEWWKPKNRVRDLVRAGAFIAAEIDRLKRLLAEQS